MPTHDLERALGAQVLLYDGVCGMCQASVRWLLRHDRQGHIRFAAQQHSPAAEVLARHGLDMLQVNSAILVSNFAMPQERIALRSDAILGCLSVLGGGWAMFARLARLVPRVVRDAAYRLVARNRTRLFGAAKLCALPTPAERARFLNA